MPFPSPLAGEYLVEKGFTILGKNHRVKFGEIDIIARHKDSIHFVEENRYLQDFSYQIDIIGILVDEVVRRAKLHYFPNAVSG